MKRIALIGALGLCVAAAPGAYAFEVQKAPELNAVGPAAAAAPQLRLEHPQDYSPYRLGPTPRMPGDKAEDMQYGNFSNGRDYAGEQLIPGPPSSAPGWVHSLSPSAIARPSR